MGRPTPSTFLSYISEHDFGRFFNLNLMVALLLCVRSNSSEEDENPKKISKEK